MNGKMVLVDNCMGAFGLYERNLNKRQHEEFVKYLESIDYEWSQHVEEIRQMLQNWGLFAPKHLRRPSRSNGGIPRYQWQDWEEFDQFY